MRHVSSYERSQSPCATFFNATSIPDWGTVHTSSRQPTSLVESLSRPLRRAMAECGANSSVWQHRGTGSIVGSLA